MGPRARLMSFCLALFSIVSASAQTLQQRPPAPPVAPQGPPRSPNGNAIYRQLRDLQPSGETISVSNLKLQRDAAVFTFASGTFTFYPPVNNKITGAVFRGQGSLHLVPPTPEEKRSLALLTKSQEFDESFETVVLRFTDGTAEELKKAASGKGMPDGSVTSAAHNFAQAMRTQLHDNLDVRLLEDVLTAQPGGFFLASIDGKHYASKMIFTLDPHGAGEVAPEEISLMTWNDMRHGIWTAFHRSDEYVNGIPSGNESNNTYSIQQQDLETTIAKSGALQGVAHTTLQAQVDGLAVVPLNLYGTLRVSSVIGPDGQQLDFVQEDKKDDPDFAVILSTPLKNGQTYTLTTTYAGKDAVISQGGNNYYVRQGARDSWYPSLPQAGQGGYARYHMTFRVPKSLDLIATGRQVRTYNEGSETVTEWQSDSPIPVAGFNLGQFKKEETTLPGGFVVDAYANVSAPDSVEELRNQNEDLPVGNLNTTGMEKVALSQGAVAVQIYTAYFGPLEFQHLALSQQTACNYGQSWPMLVYLPICGFWDTTVQHVFGIDNDPTYWKVVTPHEVAHQWWGHTVSFKSYRDQWMSEGFADFSASLFLQATRKSPDDYREFWRSQKRMLTEKNALGYRPIDVGPVTMGYRLNNSRVGSEIGRELIYPKGAYILHMLRMMMWSQQTGDKAFQALMQDFVQTYRDKPATTEDFKAAIEKHMPAIFDLEGNHKMDWFFREFVYGTALPAYGISSEATANDKGTAIHFRLTQGNVDPEFMMLVPIYIEMTNGQVVKLGDISIHGNTTIDKTINIGQTPAPVKRLLLNHNFDILSTDL